MVDRQRTAGGTLGVVGTGDVETGSQVLQPAGAIGARADRDAPCVSCGSVTATWWSTPEGRARLCPPCATLHGLGCP